MANLGYRSVEVVVVNDTRGNLTVQGVANGPGNTWVQGETPNPGDSLAQYNASKWGTETNDVNGAASAQIQLAGMGSWPVTIVFSNNSAGISTCSVAPNNLVTSIVTQQTTGEANHSLFSIQLIPGS